MQNQPRGPSWLPRTVLSLSATQKPPLGSSRGCFSIRPTPALKARADTKGSALQFPKV